MLKTSRNGYLRKRKSTYFSARRGISAVANASTVRENCHSVQPAAKVLADIAQALARVVEQLLFTHYFAAKGLAELKLSCTVRRNTSTSVMGLLT